MSSLSRQDDSDAGKTLVGFLLVDTTGGSDEDREETLDAGVFIAFKMAPSGLTNSFLIEVSKRNTEVLLGIWEFRGWTAETTEDVATTLTGDFTIEDRDSGTADSGVHELAGVLSIWGVACTMGKASADPKEFTIFVELFKGCFDICQLNELLGASMIFEVIGLTICTPWASWPWLIVKGGVCFVLQERRRTWLPAPRPCGGTTKWVPLIIIWVPGAKGIQVLIC